MKGSEKSKENRKEDLWRSLYEQDVIQLRNQLKVIRNFNENENQCNKKHSASDSYYMKQAELYKANF